MGKGRGGLVWHGAREEGGLIVQSKVHHNKKASVVHAHGGVQDMSEVCYCERFNEKNTKRKEESEV